jgi:hypothetical protein
MAPPLARATKHGFAALLIGAAAAAPLQAQEGRGTAPETTISETPNLNKEDADREARTLFEQGRVAYEDGRYRDAWDYFRQAYLLSQRPQLLYNVGQAADRLRKDREALEAFRMYLERVPKAENRREVENRVRALEQQLGEPPAMQTAPPPAADPTYIAPDAAASAGAPSAADEPSGSTVDATPAGGSFQPQRTGWYARVGLGLGVLGDAVDGSTPDTTLSSLLLVTHLAIGHDVLEGLVVAGGLDFLWGVSPQVTVGDASSDVSTANLTLVLALADYYFSPRKHGWHAGGGFGLAFLSLSETNAVLGVENPGGGAFVLSGGYDWPFAREWAVGVLGRLNFAHVGNDTADHNIVTFSVLGAATWY